MASQSERISAELDRIECEENVVVLLGVESGSRAWGFASTDSDFDVRFIYVHEPNFYLSINVEEQSDVIERPINADLDVSGWDVRKALRLFRKSNPPLLEWLQCPIIYRERFSFAARLRAFLPAFYSPKASFHHYLHMAQGNMREYLKGDVVWRKKYFYALRPLLAMHWIERGYGPVPIEFKKLVHAVLPDGELRVAVDDLIAAKRAGAELDRGPRIPAISVFIESELARLDNLNELEGSETTNTDKLNDLFRTTLAEVWEQH